MPKNKERNGEEFWRGKCRELEKELQKALNKLKAHEKRLHLIDDAHETLMEVEAFFPKEETKKRKKYPCPKCEGELLDKLEFNDKIVQECVLCNHRQTRKL